MQRKKYDRIIIGTLCFAALLAGCGQKKKSGEASGQDYNKFLPMINITESEEGVYYVQQVQDDINDYMVLKYADKNSAKETVLCQKVNCKHNSEECQAVVGETSYMGFMTCMDGRLYYMVSKSGEDDVGLYLYSVNKDGTDKKQVHKFEGRRTPPNAASMYRGKLFLSIPTIVEFEDGSGSESSCPVLVMYDLLTDEETEILEDRDSIYTVPCGGSGDSIYFLEMDYGGDNWLKYRQYDFHTKEIRDVFDGEVEDGQFVLDDTIFLQSDEKDKVETYNLKTKKREEILTCDEKYDFIYFKLGWIELVRRTKDGDRNKDFYKYYDIAEKQYLFDDFEPDTEVFVRLRFDDGRYWVEKDDQSYFYDLKDKSWTEVEEIK